MSFLLPFVFQVVHGRGPAVGDQGFVFNENNTTTSSNILIKDNKINNIKCWTKEIPCKFCRCLEQSGSFSDFPCSLVVCAVVL
jgi:hypothetical protein